MTPLDKIRALLESCSEGLPGSRYRTHEYADGSVDGEILIRPTRGVSAEDAIGSLQDSFASVPRGFWLSAGERFAIRASDEVYRKRQGLNEVSTSFQRSNRANLAEVLLILREKINTGTRKKYRRKPEVVFVRIRYSPTGKRP